MSPLGPGPRAGLRLTVVGCSGSLPGPASAASCYLVEADDDAGRTWRLVLDLGSGALGPLQRHTGLGDVDAVVLSHLHPDHCLDLCGYYVALKYGPDGGAGRRVVVHGPAGTGERLADAYGLARQPGMTAQFDFRALGDGEALQVGPLRVLPRRVRHPVEAYGFRVMRAAGDGTAVLAYSGDTDACPALVDLARDADLLLCEAAFHEGRDDAFRGIHLTGLRAGQVAAAAGARRLLVTHLPPWNDGDRTLAEATSAYAGPVSLARPDAVHEVGTG